MFSNICAFLHELNAEDFYLFDFEILRSSKVCLRFLISKMIIGDWTLKVIPNVSLTRLFLITVVCNANISVASPKPD